MAKIKLGKWEVDEEELLREIEEATRRGQESLKTEIQASSARYDRATNRLILELKNGATFTVPCELVQGLRGASPEAIAKVKLGPRGASLHWAKLDTDFSVGGIVQGRFGTKRWMEQVPLLLKEERTVHRASARKTGAGKTRVLASKANGKRLKKAA